MGKTKTQQFMDLVIDSSLKSASKLETGIGKAYGQISTSVEKGMNLLAEGQQTMSTAFNQGRTTVITGIEATKRGYNTVKTGVNTAYSTAQAGYNTAKKGYNTVKDTFYDENGWRKGRLAVAGAAVGGSLYAVSD